MKLSKKWIEASEVYKYYADDPTLNHLLDFSDESAIAMYNYESKGEGYVHHSDKDANGKINGFAFGKHMMDVQLAMWKEAIQAGDMCKFDLLYEIDLDDSKPPTFYFDKLDEVGVKKRDIPEIVRSQIENIPAPVKGLSIFRNKENNSLSIKGMRKQIGL